MQIPDSLQSRAIDLSPIGCNEVAWKKVDALDFLQSLQRDSRIVLGGDVVELVDDHWRHNYDNWHFDPVPNQPAEANSAVSIITAKQYIQNYPNGHYAFVLVLA